MKRIMLIIAILAVLLPILTTVKQIAEYSWLISESILQIEADHIGGVFARTRALALV